MNPPTYDLYVRINLIIIIMTMGIRHYRRSGFKMESARINPKYHQGDYLHRHTNDLIGSNKIDFF